MADIPNQTSSNLNATPGENFTQYEARLGAQPGAAGSGAGFGTPTSPAPAQAPAPGSVPMPPQVKSALEAAANSEGNSINSVPTRNPAPPIDYTLQPGESTADYLARTQPDLKGGTGTTKPSGGLPNINDLIAGLGARPAAPNMNTVQSNAESQVGVAGIQNNVNTLNSQLTALTNDLQNRQANEASKPGVVATIINGRMQMLSAQDSKALNDLRAQIKDANTQLSQAHTAVSTIMKNTQTNYQNASAAYDKAYSEAIQQYTAESNQQDKIQSSAKANAQVIINSYKGSSMGANSITDDERTQWQALELQAGMPAGTIEAAVKAELNVTKFVKGTGGSMYVTGTDDNGKPFVAQVVSGTNGGGTTATGEDISGMQTQLNSIRGSDGYISPENWAKAKQAWIAQGAGKKGYTSTTFNQNFSSYKNPADKYN